MTQIDDVARDDDRLAFGLLDDGEGVVELLDAIPAQAALLDAAGGVIAVNAEWRSFALANGGPADGYLGRNYLTVGEDSPFPEVRAAMAGLREVLAGRSRRLDLEYACSDKDRDRWLRCLASPLHDRRSGAVRGAMIMHMDVTSRHLAEDEARHFAQRIALIADAVPALVSYTDADLVIRVVNRRYEEWYSMPAEQIVGKRLPEFFGEKGFHLMAEPVRKVLAGEPADFEGPTAAGDRWFHASLVPHCDSEGVVRGYVALVYDITAAKESEAALDQARRQAEIANRAKSDFLASMSHELRTPLNAIIGFSEMMATEVWGPLGTERYRGYVRDIQASGSYLLGLINDVLDLSKVEAGRFELQEGPIVVEQAVASCLHMVGERARQAKVLLSHHMAGGLPPLLADERLLRQIMLNLLSNAIKFTPEGGRVTVTGHIAEDGDLHLAVRDTGIGIAAEDIPKVLEPFGQVDSRQARQHREESTGLGLPLTRRFTELHGGRLRLDSRPGAGTTVTACFPAWRLGEADL